MENEKKDLDKENLLFNEIYKIDFCDQKLNNNSNFKEWKKNMKNLYGNKLLLIKCFQDNIVFFIKDKAIDNKDYKYQCPICKKYICSYCFNSFKIKNTLYRDCCFRGRLKTIHYGGPIYGNGIFNQWIEFLLFLPFVSFLYIIGGILNSLFFQLIKPSNSYENLQLYSDYFLDNLVIYTILNFIKIFFALSIMISFIPFVILDGCITIIILFISIPFYFKPIKYIFGYLVALYNDEIVI